MPEISVLMSVYNGEKYIQEAINSILNQTYQNFELIIVNDGSVDKTREIIEAYKEPRIVLFNLEENRGVGSALQFGLQKTQGKYIAKADADDIFHPTRLEKQKKFLDDNPDIALVGSFVEYFSEDEKVRNTSRYRAFKDIIEKHKQVTGSMNIHEEMYKYCCIAHTTMMIRSEIIKKLGYKDWRIGEDYDLLYRLNKHGYKMENIPQFLIGVRVHNDSTTATIKKPDYLDRLYEIKKEEIRSLFTPQTKVYIWGGGSTGRNVLKVLNCKGLKIEGFIDSNPEMHFRVIDGKPVYSPEILKENKTNNRIIVASQPGKLAIEQSLLSFGYEHLQDYLIFQ